MRELIRIGQAAFIFHIIRREGYKKLIITENPKGRQGRGKQRTNDGKSCGMDLHRKGNI